VRRYPPGTVLAAGALVWRERDGELQVLAVHRPRYDDWSWPKGKLDKGETLPACAVREVAEETRKDIVLGQTLPTLKYPVGGGKTKVVRYWAAQVAPKSSRAITARSRFKSAAKHEIDKTKWLTVAQARERITFTDDLKPLERLAELYDAGRLETVAVVIARHARAKRRKGWHGTDDERPLSKSGTARAAQLVQLFAAFGATRIDSSPAERCMATVRPYAEASGLKIKQYPLLTEDAHASNPLGTASIVESLLSKNKNRVVCVHRPTLPTVVEMVRAATRNYTLGSLPKKNPYLPAGGVFVAHVVDTESGPRVSSVETHLLKPEA
jgi:8-oxo-dGTP pyrophosphatase MutT (NUDIX family)/phosphohistidine phosphatase SixA